jgi:hypothetical protein
MERQASHYLDWRGGDGDGVSSLSATQSIPVAAGPLVRSLLLVVLLLRVLMRPFLAEVPQQEPRERQKTQGRSGPLVVWEENSAPAPDADPVRTDGDAPFLPTLELPAPVI